MIKRLLTIFLLVKLLVASDAVKASHIVGGDITVKWISGNNFEVTLVFIRDCAGIPSQVPTLAGEHF